MQTCPISCVAATDANNLHITTQKRHVHKRENTTHQKAVEQSTPIAFQFLPDIAENEPHFIDHYHQRDPYWSDDPFGQQTLDFGHISNKSTEQIEDDDIITDSHELDQLRYSLTDIWTVNPLLPNTSLLPTFRSQLAFKKRQKPVLDTEIITTLNNSWQQNEILDTIDWPPVEKQEEDAIFPIVFGLSTTDGLNGKSTMSFAISEADSQKIRLLPPQKKFDE